MERVCHDRTSGSIRSKMATQCIPPELRLPAGKAGSRNKRTSNQRLHEKGLHRCDDRQDGLPYVQQAPPFGTHSAIVRRWFPRRPRLGLTFQQKCASAPGALHTIQGACPTRGRRRAVPQRPPPAAIAHAELFALLLVDRRRKYALSEKRVSRDRNAVSFQSVSASLVLAPDFGATINQFY
jgi:hypothetical protein